MKKYLIPVLAFFFIVTLVKAYEVRSGDTLWKIARDANVTISQLLSLNPDIKNPNLIHVGDTINTEETFGATLPIAGSTYNLSGSGITGSATSITLQSLTLRQTGQKIQDSDLSDTFYLTLEPGNNTRQEIAACTTLTQNANGTATVSGCSRGMSPITPYTASTTLQFSHAGGVQVIFSDPPQLFNLFGAFANNNLWIGENRFGTTTTDGTDKGYVGIGTSSPAFVKNISGLLYYCNFGASCAAIGAGANTYAFELPLRTSGSNVQFASSTYWFELDDNLFAIATTTIANGTASGKGLDDLWNARWNATTTRSSLVINDNATTTGVFNFGNLSLGNGNLIYPFSVASTSPATTTMSGANKQGSIATTTIPMNSMGTDGMIKITFRLENLSTNEETAQKFRIFFGGQTACEYLRFQKDLISDGECWIINDNATNIQKAYGHLIDVGMFGSDALGGNTSISTSTTLGIDTTQNQNITFDVRTGSQAGDYMKLLMSFVEVAKR